MLGSGADGKKPIKEIEKLRAHKPKLEPVSSERTKPKKLDEELYKTLADWDKTLDAISDWIAVTDLNGRILRTNRSGGDFTGKPLTEIIGQSCCKLVHGSEERIPGCPLQKMLSTRQRESTELKIPDANRWLIVTVVPITDKEGNLVRAVHITRDITDRKKAESALQRERDKAQRYLDVAGVMLVAIDSQQRVGLINKKGCEILGYKEEEILAKNWFDNFLPEKVREEVRAVFKKIVQSEADAPEYYENPVLTKSGDERFVAWHNTTLRDDQGNFIATLSSGENITQRKQAETALKRSETYLRTVLSNAPITIFAIDNQGLFSLSEGKGLDRVGLKPGENVGVSASSLYGTTCFIEYNGTVTTGKDIIQRVFAGETVKAIDELRGVYFDNHIGPIRDTEGKVIGIVGVATDITDLKQAEQALQASEQRYRELFENAGEGIIILDMNGRITEANRLVEEYGFDRAELLGSKLFDFVPEYDKDRSVSDFQALISGSRVQGQMDVITPKGIRTVEYRDTPIVRAGEVVGVQAILTDITERKRAEEAYRSLVDHSLQGLAIFQNGRVVFANQTMADITGYPVEEMLTLPPEQVQAFVHPDDRELVWSRHRERLCGKSLPERYEFRGIRKDGSTCWLELHASLIEYQGKPAIQAAYVNITERKMVEEALKESEEKFKSIFEHANDGIIYLDSSGNILDINERAVRMFGGPKQQAVNKHFTEIGVFSPDEIPMFMSSFKKIFAGEEVVLTVPIKNKKGQKIILECSTSVAKTDDGAGRIMVIARDITERKKAEDVISKLAKFPDEDPYPVLRISGHGTVIYGNKASVTLLKAWDCQVGKSLPDHWHEFILDALSSGQSQQTEVQCDDRIFALTFAPVVEANYVNIYGLDITERKKAEESLWESQERYRALVENTLIGIVVLDTNYKIIMVNSMVAGLFKKPASDFVGKYCFKEFEKREAICSHCPGKRAIDSGKTEEVETQGVRDDGSRFYVRNRAVPFFGPDGVMKGFIEMIEDITECKQADKELIENQAKLKAMASKMLMTEERERQSLAMGLHDEVCQKLVLTKLALESSLSLVSDPNVLASLKIACAGIGETIEKANSLTFELSNPVLRQLGFIVALEKYLADEIQQKYGIAYELESDEQLGTIQDEIKNCLFRVTRELLTNVVKHAHARKVRVSVHESRGRIYVSVQDDGMGFKESQANAKVSKTARFGLFSIREQLEYLGGHLEIESEPGRGTAATIVVPQTKKAIV